MYFRLNLHDSYEDLVTWYDFVYKQMIDWLTDWLIDWFTRTGEVSNLGLLQANHSESGRNSTSYSYHITKITGSLTHWFTSPLNAGDQGSCPRRWTILSHGTLYLAFTRLIFCSQVRWGTWRRRGTAGQAWSWNLWRRANNTTRWNRGWCK